MPATIRTPDAALDQATKGPLNEPSRLPPTLAEHRRAHRSGVPARIASDPELEAFVRARIGQMTFAQIIAEVAATFPPAPSHKHVRPQPMVESQSPPARQTRLIRSLPPSDGLFRPNW